MSMMLVAQAEECQRNMAIKGCAAFMAGPPWWMWAAYLAVMAAVCIVGIWSARREHD